MKLSSNLWKVFLFNLSQRRHFITLLSIYFLTLPNTTAQQIGLYSGIGSLSSFLFEIPSGYLADRFGHKRTLIVAKVLMTLSMTSFAFGRSFWFFVVGAVFLNLSFAFTSGTTSAFMHNTLIALGREKEYGKVMSRLSANVSLLSVGFIVALPLLTVYNIRWPFYLNLFFDFLGLIIVFSLVSPRQKLARAHASFRGFLSSIRSASAKGFYPTAVFLGVVGGFLLASSPYRNVYLEFLGFPIALIGTVMGVSRLVWFGIGHFAYVLEEKVGIERLFLFESVFFPLCFLLAVIFPHPYFVGVLFAVLIGYRWGRSQIVQHYILSFVKKEELKATVLSVKGQISRFFQTIIAFSVAFVMQRSFSFGFLVFSLVFFLCTAVFWSVRRVLLPKSI